MKKLLSLSIVLLLLVLFLIALSGPWAKAEEKKINRAWTYGEMPIVSPPGDTTTNAYTIVYYTFDDGMQGWTSQDKTQHGTYFHADDFTGLDGYAPLEGTKSMWCGARPNYADPYLVNWISPPGYGNDWNQMLISDPIPLEGGMYNFSYIARIDCAAGDTAFLDAKVGDADWELLAAYCSADTYTETYPLIIDAAANLQLRFRFVSNNYMSDEDGGYNSCGAFVVDELLLESGGIPIYYENFESWTVGANDNWSSIWHGRPINDLSTNYSGRKNNLQDKDPCNINFTYQIVFFIGSTYPSGAYPTLYDTPYLVSQDELLISPFIDLTRFSSQPNDVQDAQIPPGVLPSLGKTLLKFTVYRDLPLSNLVFYKWHVRTVRDGVYFGPWMDRGFLYYGGKRDYEFMTEDISDLVGNEFIQIALGVVDMYREWNARFDYSWTHTPAPWFDNVRIVRFTADGPQWSYRDIDLFQDNFPMTELEIESYVRADMAQDISPFDNPVIRPGDSIVVSCRAPLKATAENPGGLATDATGAHIGGAAVYMHVRVQYRSTDGNPLEKPLALYGSQLAGTYGWYDSDDGEAWTIMQMDTARTATGIVANKWMCDLNDSLFTRGYRIDYYFVARDAASVESSLPQHARTEWHWDRFEFTCLPTLGSDILFVDDFSGRGSIAGAVQDYWTSAFKAVLPESNQPDRYDINGPSSGVSNGLASRALQSQIDQYYFTIIWDSGDLEKITISDGTLESDKSSDIQMLMSWMNQSQHRVGLWICGDDVANDLASRSAGGNVDFMGNYCGVAREENSFYERSGGEPVGEATPEVSGHHDDPHTFQHAGIPDQFILLGNCPIVNEFDVLQKTINGHNALYYRPIDTTPLPPDTSIAAVLSTWTNNDHWPVRTMWFGFSCQYIFPNSNEAPIDRFEIVRDVLAWMQYATNVDITHSDAPRAYRLAQNYPNPFNPRTTIRFDMKEKGAVTIKVYNVAGQLVRTLLDEVRDIGSHSVVWDGKNNLGHDVRSGIYLCRMETQGFVASKKLVMLR